MDRQSLTSSEVVGARLDRLQISRFHYKILLLIGLGMFFDGFDIYMLSGVLAHLTKTGWSTISTNAMIVSAGFFGLTIGALLSGWLGDRYGRKFMFQFNLLVFSLASIAAALSPNPAVLITLRFIAGIGLGGEIVTGYATLAEFIPAARRGRWQSLLALITNLSLPISALVSLWIIPSVGWRWMFVIGGLPALFVWWLRRSLPESPRWLESKGRVKEANELVTQIEYEASQSIGRNIDQISESTPTVRQGSFSELFSRGMWRRTLVAILMLVVMNSVVYGFTTWIPTIFVQSGLTITTSLAYNAVILLGGPVGALIGYLITDSVGRKWTSVILSCIGAVLAFLYATSQTPVIILCVGFVLLVITYLLVTISFGMYVPELFPTSIRLRGTGLANAFGRAASIVIPYVIGSLVAKGTIITALSLIAGLLLVQALTVSIFGIETKRKSLESIAGDVTLDQSPTNV